MSDIVWTINPKHDQLADLIYRMRRFADEIIAGNSDLGFDLAVDSSTANALDITVRRDVFLIFKESLHNAIRHSACTQVRARIRVESGQLALSVTDNGKGFVAARLSRDRSGLDSMQKRAARLGGKLTITSQPGSGTSVEFSAPLLKRYYINM
jgi:signal transduction histidine kinase